MTATVVTPARVPLAGVIAVTGCDGSGKSTLTADLVRQLGAEHRVAFVYLGQSSGHIGQQIARLPLLGPLLGRYLAHKAERANDNTASAPDAAAALVMHLLSLWRAHKFKRMLRWSRQGVVVVTDRYPQAEVPGFKFDGPGWDASLPARGLVRWLARRELHLYGWMAGHLPTLLVRLNIDAETAQARKPDHRLATLQAKVRVIPGLRFNAAPLLDLDARDPYAQVRDAALRAARAALNATGSPASPGPPHR